MSLNPIFDLIAISGIFSKNDEELDILPPLPQFPEVEDGDKETGRIKKREEKQRERELKIKEKEEEEKRRQEEKERGAKLRKEKKKAKEDKRKQKLEEERKKELERGKQRELEEKKKLEGEREKELELISRKTEKFERKIVKSEDVVKTEEEIQKAISGMAKAKRPSVIMGLFKKKRPLEEKIETPEVMPRTYDKIDHVELIEEKAHKARLALMDFKFDDAKRVYIEIMKIYHELEPKKKLKVYQDIKDLYYERKSAEKFAK